MSERIDLLVEGVLAAQRMEKVLEDNGYLIDIDEDGVWQVSERPTLRKYARR